MVDASRVGEVLAGKYRLDRELGRGGMGAVYRAFHLRVHKEFAVKLLLAEVAGHKSIAQRFLLEAQAAGRIGHPGILEVYDVGEDERGSPFIVMELLDGEPLSALLRRRRLDARTACWVTMRILEILEAAHEANVVHRDVKPQNVFLCRAEGETRTLKLLDFGIAKFASSPDASAITRSGEIIGSPLYMAPEQAKGELDVDARADIWSVGAMLFEMLTGAPAHAASTPVAVLAKILTEPAPPPSGRNDALPSELDAIVQRALSIDREQRWASARAMIDALADVHAKLGWPAAPPAFPPIVVSSEDDARGSGAITSTIEAPTAEPPLEAAVTNDRKPPAPRPPWAKVALVALAAGVLIPFVWPASTKAPAPAASAPAVAIAPPQPPPAPSSAPEPVPLASEGPPAPASASASASAAPPVPKVSAPRCPAGEVLSSGHCCPRGLVWQSGRCERPLATSF